MLPRPLEEEGVAQVSGGRVSDGVKRGGEVPVGGAGPGSLIAELQREEPGNVRPTQAKQSRGGHQVRQFCQSRHGASPPPATPAASGPAAAVAAGAWSW